MVRRPLQCTQIPSETEWWRVHHRNIHSCFLFQVVLASPGCSTLPKRKAGRGHGFCKLGWANTFSPAKLRQARQGTEGQTMSAVSEREDAGRRAEEGMQAGDGMRVTGGPSGGRTDQPGSTDPHKTIFSKFHGPYPV